MDNNDLIKDLKRRRKERTAKVLSIPLIKSKSEDSQNKSKVTGGLASKLKGITSQQTMQAKEEQLRNEKLQVKQEYLSLYANQQIALNQVVKMLDSTITKYIDSKVRETEFYNIDDVIVRSELEEKAVARQESKAIYEQIGKSIITNVYRDFENASKLQIQSIAVLEPEDIELVRKVKLTDKEYIIYTDENQYIFDGKEMSQFGGYLYYRRQILTEILDARELMRSNRKGVSEIDDNPLMFLLVNPLLMNVEGKTILMDIDPLKLAVKELESKFSRSSLSTEKFKDIKKAEDDSNYIQTPREILERFMKEFELPTRADVIWYPFHLLPECDIELELEFKEMKQNYIETLEGFDYDRVGYIPFTQLEALARYSKIIKILDEFKDCCKVLSRRYDRMAKFYNMYEQEDLEQILNDIIEQEEQAEFEDNDNTTELNNKNKEIEDEKDEGEEDESAKAVLKGLLKRNKNGISSEIIYSEIRAKLISAAKNYCTALENLPISNLAEVIKTLSSESNLPANLDFHLKTTLNAFYSIVNSNRNVLSFSYPEDIRYLGEKIQDYYLQELIDLAFKNVGGLTELEELRLELEQVIEDYVEYIEKIRQIQSVINSMSLNPFLQNITASVERKYGETIEVAGTILDVLMDRDLNLKKDVDNLSKQYIPVISSRLGSKGYTNLRNLINYIKSTSLQNITWYEILKLSYLENMKLLPLSIKLTPTIRQLIQVQEFRPLLSVLNSAGRFVENDGIVPTHVMNFNLMMDEIVNNFPALITAIDYEGLLTYFSLVEKDSKPLQGYELIRYIPSVKLVDKYFNIQETSFTLPKVDSDKLITYVSRLPLTYLALNFLADSVVKKFSAKEDLFVSVLEDIQRLNKLRVDLQRVKAVRKLKEKSALETEYDMIRKKLVKILSDEKLYKANPNFLSLAKLEQALLEFTDEMCGLDYYLEKKDPSISDEEFIEKYKEEKRKLREEVIKEIEKLKSIDKNLTIVREEIKEEEIKLKEEILIQIEMVTNIIREKIGSESEVMIQDVLNDYSADMLESVVVSAWKGLGFNDFQKGRTLLSFIISFIETNTYSEIVKSSILTLVYDLLRSAKEIKEEMINSGKKPYEALEHVFKYVCFHFRLENVLELTALDKLEIAENFEEVDLTEDEKSILKDLFESIQDLSESEISAEILNFDRKDIIPDELYVTLAYSDTAELERIYPNWYNRDFNLAENIKIMLLCGVPKDTIHPSHLADAKLMRFVEEVSIPEEWIEYLKQFQ